jgi:hypothetical protein
MKINEILVESHQLDEGPLMNKIGTAIGKGVGTAAKAVGSVAGGVAGAFKAAKKGFQAGKDVVSAAGDDDTPPATDTSAAPAAGTADASASAAPATAKGGGVAAQPAAKDVNATGPAGTAPAQNLQGAAKAAADKTAAATQDQNAAQAGQTMYAQVKANIDKLDKKGKQRILQLLQKSVQAPAAKPAAGASAAPAADAGAGAMGQMAGQLAKGGAEKSNTMANAPVSKTNTAKPGNPNAAPAAGTTQDGEPQWDPATGKGAKYDGVTGEMTPAWKAEQDKQAAAKQTKAAPTAEPAPAPAQQTTGQAATQAADAGGDAEKAALDTMKAKNPKLAGMMAQAGMDDQGNDVAPVKKRGGRKTKPAAPSQAEIDADRDARMGPTSDSIIRKQPALAEGFSLFRKSA